MKCSDRFSEFSGLFFVSNIASAARWTIYRVFECIQMWADTAPDGLVFNVLLHCTQL